MWWFRRFYLAKSFWPSGHLKAFFYTWSLAMWLVMLLLQEIFCFTNRTISLMNTSHVLIQFTFSGECFITNWTFVWFLSFTNNENVLIQLTFLGELFITNWTFVMLSFFIFHTYFRWHHILFLEVWKEWTCLIWCC